MHKNQIPRAITLLALAFSALVFGASPSPETRGTQVSFYGCDSNGCANLSANSGGQDGGQVFLQLYDTSYDTLLVISCFGPEYAGAVSASAGSGRTSIVATLDASRPGCWGFQYGGTAPPVFTLNMTGVFDGAWHTSKNGVEIFDQAGTVTRYNFQEDCFSLSVSGTASPDVGSFSQGSACISNSIYR